MVDSSPPTAKTRFMRGIIRRRSARTGSAVLSGSIGQSRIRQLARGGVAISAVRIWGAACSAASGIVLARGLGPAGRGEFAVLWTVASFGVLLGGCGLPTGLTYYAARERRSIWINRLVLVQPAVGVGVILVVALTWRWLFPWTLSGLSVTGLVASAFLAAALLLVLLIQAVLLGRQRYSTYVLTEFASKTTLVLVPAVLLITGIRDAGTLVAGLGLTILFVALPSARATIQTDGKDAPELGHVSRPRELYGFSLRPFVGTVLLLIVTRVAVFVLNKHQGPAGVGYYSAALQLAEVLSLIGSGIGAATFAKSANRELSASTFLEGFWKTCAALTLCGSVVFVFASPLVRLLFGRDFGESIAITRVLLPGSLAMSASSLFSNYLAGRGYPWYLVGIWIPAVLINLWLNAELVPSLGGIGAAFAYTVTHFAVVTMLIVYFLRDRSRTRQFGVPEISAVVPESL